MVAITFGLFASAGKSEQEAVLLVKSLRRFGGGHSNSPVHIYTPRNRVFSGDNLALLSQLNVQMHLLELPDSVLEFPFASKVLAAGIFEAQEMNHSEMLVWMDRDSLIINDPEALILPPGKILGCRPVDHQLIGSTWNQPPDNFWETIYNIFELAEERVFPIYTTVDRQQIRPYFNAGMLIVRPQARLLQTWSDEFISTFQKKELTVFYNNNVLYQIFIHQVVLSVVICKLLEREQLYQLPYNVNYPLHMHSKFPPDSKTNSLNELVTCRHDGYFETKDWQSTITIHEPLKSWLNQNLIPLLED